MGTLYLVRHGQASFGAADYDVLSALGARQCAALGAWFAEHGIVFGAVLRGTLRRHAESLDAIAAGYGADAPLPPALPWPGLNEYDSLALLHASHDGELGPADTPAAYRAHFKLLRSALVAWMEERIAPAGMPSHAAWVAGIVGALDHVRAHCSGDVLLVSSGGPIATAVGHVLDAPAATTIELNLRLRNSALTEFDFNARRHVLVSFNHLPHLDDAARREWVTHT